MSLFCTVCAILVENRRFNLPTSLWRRRWGDPVGISLRSLAPEN